jgi:hypothetical protein
MALPIPTIGPRAIPTATAIGQHAQASGSQSTSWEVFAIVLGAIVILETLYIVAVVFRGRGRRAAATARPAVQRSGAVPQDLGAGVAESPPQQTQPVSLPDRGPGDKPWLDLVEEIVLLFDELEQSADKMEPQGRAIALHVCDRLREILERSGVEVIANDSTFDLMRHRPEPAVASVPAGSPIQETLSPGFAVGRRVLRRAIVRIPKSQG